MVYLNDFFGPNIAPAVDGELCAADPTCIPYEVFTYQGVTPEAAAGLAGVAAMAGKTSTAVINGYVTGDLGFGLPTAEDSIMVVAGFEFREEKFERISDDIFKEGSLLGQGGEIPSITGKYSVDEFFVEANIPLLSDLAFARNMTLDLAYRWSDYSTSGRTNTYRAGLVWQMVDWLRVRTGYNRAVRIPNTGELFALRQIFGWWTGYTDPCWGSDPIYSLEQCIRTGVTPEQYGNILPSPAYDHYNILWGGNPDLDPETADTITLGLVIDASDGMQFSFDYWDIRIEDVIGNIEATVIMDQCALFSQLCQQIHRAENGSLWLSQQGYVDATRLNLGGQHFSGIDMAFTWSHDALGGNFNVNMIGTYILKKETTLIPNDPDSIYDCAGLISAECNWVPTPRWRHTASATFDSNSFWAVTGRWRYFGKAGYEGTIDQIANDNLSAQNYFDLNAVFRFMETHDVIFGVNNVFDKEPPLVGSTLSWNGNTIAGFYDSLGRYVFANVTLRW